MTGTAPNPLLAGLYGDAEVVAHLSPEAEIGAMIRFEAALARVEARLGIIPDEAGAAIDAVLGGLRIPAESLAAGTTAAGVPVPGLVKALRSAVGAPHGGYVHWGATSQDAMDTGLVLRLGPILDILEQRLRRLVDLLAGEARRHARLPMAGRTRSQIATPTTLGLRIAAWLAPLARCLDRLAELRPRLLVVQLGGASGNLSILGAQGPAAMEALAAELGLAVPAKPWGTERDGLVELANWLAMVSGLLGRIGADLIVMGRSEIAELAAGQGGGSSTMPQKANPVAAETLITLARIAAAQTGLMQAALIHTEERDATAWAIEWAALPQLLTATGAGVTHALSLAASLRPAPGRMQGAMATGGGAIEAEALAFALARHVPLDEAQAIVKAAARRVAEAGGTLGERLTELCHARGLPAPAPGSGDATDAAAALVERLLDALGRPG
ncbi:lyase family protein [Limibaculum sp. FT325]|uniref:lyase family protein n=1 Tax=Thermohalobaculum sediminis TaxID=2939436 RepID=UPI0020BD8D0B|nr:lyase family protein [Limibaculum sediminis]MCL5778248.1 lyase family protein [Limibaculum sediminis]